MRTLAIEEQIIDNGLFDMLKKGAISLNELIRDNLPF